MNRFTLFALRLVACVLVLAASVIATAVRAWAGMPSDDVMRGLMLGVTLAWAIAPSNEDIRAFVGLMQADD